MAPAANGLAASSTVPVALAGEAVRLLAGRALHWPAAGTLIVADLHWGKAETFHDAGVPIPDGILADDLARLDGILAETGADRLLVLGDLIHSGAGLTERLVAEIAQWRARRPVMMDLVPGNHDRHAASWPGAWNVRLLDHEVVEGPFRFLHDPVGGGAGYAIGGHIHPLFRLSDGFGTMRLPCFWVGSGFAVLPAFSIFTRGRVIAPTPGDRAFVIAGEAVFEAPLCSARQAR